MDYIDPLKRAAIPLGTIVVLSSGSALAQDQLTKADLVQLVVTLGVYDNRCEKLAPRCWLTYSAWSGCSIRTT